LAYIFSIPDSINENAKVNREEVTASALIRGEISEKQNLFVSLAFVFLIPVSMAASAGQETRLFLHRKSINSHFCMTLPDSIKLGNNH